tara:strand:- start:348 stop:926 length:579 start_codon:yes stop_codon:yes gene_type:complete
VKHTKLEAEARQRKINKIRMTGKDGRHIGYTAKWNYRKDPKCSTCDRILVKDQEDANYNWRPARVARHTYMCNPCSNIERRHYRLKKQIHGYQKEYVARFNQIKQGFVYVLTNPAWKGWIKVGMAVDADDRCNSYQTSSPHRDYEIQHKRFFKNRKLAESKAHDILSDIAKERNGEWFKMDMRNAQQAIDNI